MTSVLPSGSVHAVDTGSFVDLGIAAPISYTHGANTLVTAKGENILCAWLADKRGYAVLQLNAATGEVRETPLPFDNISNDYAYAFVRSAKGKIYTLFGFHFLEYDPERQEFTFCGKTSRLRAMSLHEDRQGRIWAATHPDGGLASFHPETRELVDYGSLNEEKWEQYPTHLASDDEGWAYLGIGYARQQIIAFHAEYGEIRKIIPEGDRICVENASAEVMSASDGHVYGRQTGVADSPWFQMKGGMAKIVRGGRPAFETDAWGQDSGNGWRSPLTSPFLFPDGTKIDLNLVDRQAMVAGRDGRTREITFQYASEGIEIMQLDAAPDGSIAGGTFLPCRFFSYRPKMDEWIRHDAKHQCNTVFASGESLYIGAYWGGYLMEWRPDLPWTGAPDDVDLTANPRLHAKASPHVYRPHVLSASPDGRTVLMGGTPAYGRTGGGLALLDTASGRVEVIPPEALLGEESVRSGIFLTNDLFLGGGTVSGGTGGEARAKKASLFLFDLPSKNVLWKSDQWLTDVLAYWDMIPLGEDRVAGIAGMKADADAPNGWTVFFVFDWRRKEMLNELRLSPWGECPHQQGVRVFVRSGDTVYLLLRKAIMKVNPATLGLEMEARTPAGLTITSGGAALDGCLYFAGGSHLYRYRPQALNFLRVDPLA